MAGNNRPLSPHLQIYRLPLTGILSITHRITGVFLTIGLALLLNGLWALSQGPEGFAGFQEAVDSGFGRLILFGFIAALFFHFCHGVRHLIWDLGSGFLKQNMNLLAGIEIACVVVLIILAY